MTTPNRFRFLLLTLLAATLASAPLPLHAEPPATVRTIGPPHTLDGIGYGQGIARRGDLLYLYGDAGTGVIRECRTVRSAGRTRVEWTGREIRLTVRGEDVAPHPTGLTFHPDHGAFLGNTVNRKGTIFHIDWDRALADGTLDGAILNVARDDAAVNGCRPEFVRFRGEWCVATSDYGSEGNQVRLYDPTRLATAERTSEEGVLLHAFDCRPFVQTLCWLDDREQLVLVQNVTPGRGYRLTFASWNEDGAFIQRDPLDIPALRGELEGAAPLGGSEWLLLEARPIENVRIVELQWR